MSSAQPQIPPEEVQAFAFAVGKAVQNYGTIEYLVNELIALLVSDPLLVTTFNQLGIAKRLDLLASLVERRKDSLAAQGWSAGNLFEQTKAAFQDRNKIAHNPYVIKESSSNGATQIIVGIHVVRYNKAGSNEEWIGKDKLEAFTLGTRDLLIRFNQLLGCCKAMK